MRSRKALALVVALAMLVVTREHWLAAAAGFLVVDEPVAAADVIAVFAGGGGERADHAAALFAQGLAPRILVTGGEASGAVELVCGERLTGAELSARRLARAGVPADAVTIVPRGTSTYEEAAVVREFLTRGGHHTVIAVSSAYHMRRVGASLRHHLRGDAVVRLSAAPTRDFDPRRWWRDEHGLLLVTHEYLKLAYYHLARL
jgi:uncharacterized SAM-binding protein YcdF (DUF218 family)